MARALHLINKIYCLFNKYVHLYKVFSNKSLEITMDDNDDAFIPKAINHFKYVSIWPLGG